MRRWRLCLTGGCLACLMALAAMAVADPAPPVGVTAPIRVVSDFNYPPFVFLDADGKPQGYVVDRWKLFQAHTGIRVDLVPMDWVAAQQQIRQGRADAIDMIFRTPAREPLYDFSAPYATLPVGIYVDRRIHGVRDLSTLRGLPVGVERGDACAERLRAAGVTDLREFDDYQSLITAAAHGDLRIFCMDDYPAEYFLYRDSALSRFGRAFPLYQAHLRVAVRKGNVAMLRTIERGMAQITPAEQAALRRRWLEQPFVLEPYMRAAKWMAAAALALAALLALWIGTMRRQVRARTRELRAGQGQLRALFDANPDALWVKDGQGIYRDCNDRVFEVLGLERRQLIGHRDEELFDPARLAAMRAMDDLARQQGRHTCVLSIDVGGTRRQLEVTHVALPDAAGAGQGILGVARDVTERLRAEAALRLWGQAFQYAAFGVAIFDVRSRCITAANPTFARERGYTPEEMVGMPADELYPPDLVASRAAQREACLRDKHTLVETEQVTRDGRRFPVLLDVSGTHDADGTPESVIVLAQDISERKRVESALLLAEAAFESQGALLVADAQGAILRVNRAFTRFTGYAPDEVLGKSPSMLSSPYHPQPAVAEVLAGARATGIWQGERWIRLKNGQIKVVRSTVSIMRGGDGQVSRYIFAVVDLTGERAAHESVERMTYFDPLTDLPNRLHLHGRLQQMRVSGVGGVLLLIDLDHFKRVNDLRGHAEGDHLLTLVARRLRRFADGERLLGRFSGGTFALVVPVHADGGMPPAGVAWDDAGRVRESLREPFRMPDGSTLTVTASIGWTELSRDQENPAAVLKDAELAMYQAKAAGRDQARRYEPAMRDALLRHEALVRDLRAAIDADTLELQLQGQVDLHGRTTGAEALLRWTRPCGERVPPNVFVAFAEENGLILPLGDWVLRHACTLLADWSTQPALRGLALAANVSAKQFAQPGFVDGVRAALAASGADPRRLKLEITESAILDDIDEAADKLNRLRAMGIRISLDDFGTGYSSLAYLSRLPLDQLKIDQSFVARLPDDANDAMVAQTIIGMGRGLGLEVIAEGVETEAQRRFLAEQGCDAFQGYLFARPQPRDTFEAVVAGLASTAA